MCKQKLQFNVHEVLSFAMKLFFLLQASSTACKVCSAVARRAGRLRSSSKRDWDRMMTTSFFYIIFLKRRIIWLECIFRFLQKETWFAVLILTTNWIYCICHTLVIATFKIFTPIKVLNNIAVYQLSRVSAAERDLIAFLENQILNII